MHTIIDQAGAYWSRLWGWRSWLTGGPPITARAPRALIGQGHPSCAERHEKLYSMPPPPTLDL